MAQIIVRNLTEQAVDRLKQRAKEHKRSLEAEVRDILENEAAGHVNDRELVRRVAAQMRRELADVPQSDSADLIRADRDR